MVPTSVDCGVWEVGTGPNSGVELAGITDLGARPLTVKIDGANGPTRPHSIRRCREAFLGPLKPLASGILSPNA
jgi:hypothetical protein